MVNTRSKTKKIQEDSDHQSGALIGSSDDLLTEILIRLPVTSILRFKSVSKHWRLLLSGRHFTHRYDNKLSKSPGLFVGHIYVPFDVENRSTPPFRCLDFCYDRHGIKILQSCNGLLLCCSDRGDIGVRRYYVFNPTTKQFAIIPSVPGGRNVRKTICFMALAFYLTDCVHYKLVCIRALENAPLSEFFQIQIYSSVTRKWKISIESFSPGAATFRKGFYWNGALHWAPSYHNHLYFKIDVEQLQTLALPAEMASYRIVTMYFGESRGHLHLIVCNYRNDNCRLNVYEMLTDYSGWFVKYRIDVTKFISSFPEMISSLAFGFHVVDVVRGEEEEDTFMVLNIRKNILIYNAHDKSFKQIFRLPNNFYESGFHRYTETLVCF